MMVMLHLNINRAAPRPKTYLLDTVDFEDDTELKDLGLVGLTQGNDYRAGRNKVFKDKCKRKEKSLRKCLAKHGSSARKCRRKAKRFTECMKENPQQKNDYWVRDCVMTDSCHLRGGRL